MQDQRLYSDLFHAGLVWSGLVWPRAHRLDRLVLLDDQVIVLEAMLPVPADVCVLVGNALDGSVEGPARKESAGPSLSL